MRKMKKALAVILSAAMVMGMSMTTFAADQEVSVDAPIYAYDVTQVVVPTTFVVAFNPDGLSVDVDGDGTGDTTDQIISKNYGIINKSTKDKIITVTLEVEDLNEDKITSASAADVTNASESDYVLSLDAIPADTSEVQVGGASADKDTAGAALADVTMTKAASVKMPLMAGENEIDFVLQKAEYDGTIDLSTATGNNVADKFTLKNLAANGKGITAFTFGGTMNNKADWTKLTKGIRITAVYSNENAPAGGATPETGTGAFYNNPYPVFKTGDAIGTIKYKPGTGNDAITSITKIEMDNAGNVFDGFNSYQGLWEDAKNENGLITLQPEYMKFYTDAYPNDETREATITYETAGGTKTAKVDVRLKEKEIVAAPSFTTGSGVGTINYTPGAGSSALASISKVEMDNNGNIFDGYNADTVNGGLWAAATDSDGLITLSTDYMQFYIDGYPADNTREATITYVTVGGETKTATVDVKLK